ncbi:MAG: FecR family protein [Bacteroidota bacterium]
MEFDNYIENLIARYLNGDCTVQETEELLQWIRKDPVNQKAFSEIKDTWDSIQGKNLSTDEQLLRFYKKQLEKRKVIRLSLWKQAVAVAAVLAIGLFSGIMLMQTSEKQVKTAMEFSVPLGSKSSFVLEDGSTVTLNSGSRLVYSQHPKTNSREAFLEGEGYFSIVPDKKQRFIVNTSDFAVEVTGTEFNVCAYPDNPFSSTTLAEGSVQITFNRSGQIYEINPGERLRYDREANRFSRAAVDIEPEIAWKDGEFIFRNIAFSELVRRLERWYDVQITWSAAELRQFTYTGRFKNQETIWQVLDALKLTTPIDYSRISFREFEIMYKKP